MLKGRGGGCSFRGTLLGILPTNYDKRYLTINGFYCLIDAGTCLEVETFLLTTKRTLVLLIGFFFKISDEHPRLFYMEASPRATRHKIKLTEL